MLAEYTKLELAFRYPPDWSVADEELGQWPHRVSVQGPGAAYWEVQVFPSIISPLVLGRQAMEVFRQEYSDIDAESVSEDIAARPTVGFDLDFFCLDFLVTGKIRSFCHEGRTYLLIWQAENRDFAQLSEEFDAITRSLLAAIKISDEPERPNR